MSIDNFVGYMLSPVDIECHPQHPGVAAVDSFQEACCHGPCFGTIKKYGLHSCLEQSYFKISTQVRLSNSLHLVACSPSFGFADIKVVLGACNPCAKIDKVVNLFYIFAVAGVYGGMFHVLCVDG